MSKSIPYFKYHPEPLKTGAFEAGDPVICDCCGNETSVFYGTPFYAEEEIEYLCPECIKNGKASEEFDGEFQDPCSCDRVSDAERLKELCRYTSGYCGWQQERWLAHCDDFCAYLGHVGWKEIVQMGIEAEVEKDYIENGVYDIELVKKGLSAYGSMQGYLFRCLHCGQYRICVDFD